jgi:hypothetical protein
MTLKVHLKHTKALKINSFVASIPPMGIVRHELQESSIKVSWGVIMEC